MTTILQEYLKKQFKNFKETLLDEKLSAIHISYVPNTDTLIVPSECKSNWSPDKTVNTSRYEDGSAANGYYTTNLIENAGNGAVYKTNILFTEYPTYFRLFCYDTNGIFRTALGDKDHTNMDVDTDGYITFTSNSNFPTFCIVTTMPLDFENLKIQPIGDFKLRNATVNIPDLSSPLKGKKWAPCGDSFTAGAYITDTISEGKYVGTRKTYPYLIANRNNMTIFDKVFEGGRTIAQGDVSSNTNNLISHYMEIPEDIDYITIYLGINDSIQTPDNTNPDVIRKGLIALGTISDETSTTFYGAWNTILGWLIVNRPNAKIGIIVSNAMTNISYKTATIEIAKKWGVPYIDLNGDERTPAMQKALNNDLCQDVKDALNNKWALVPQEHTEIVDGEEVTVKANSHPNVAAHAFESTIIENFLKSL